MVADLVESLMVAACWLVPLLLVYGALSLLLPIIKPTIIEYPWKMPTSAATRRDDKKKVVVLAGSYNPPHNGHLAMLEYLAERYGQVIAVVGMNPNKKYLVLPEERVELIQTMIKDNPKLRNVRAQAVSGYIWRFAKKEGASYFFRGIRSWEKDGTDERSLQILNTWGPLILGPTWPVPTIYLEGKPEFNHVSSTLIRSICRGGATADGSSTEALSSLVPTNVSERVTVLYSRKDE